MLPFPSGYPVVDTRSGRGSGETIQTASERPRWDPKNRLVCVSYSLVLGSVEQFGQYIPDQTG